MINHMLIKSLWILPQKVIGSIDKSKTSTGGTIAASAASIDKNKLEQQVNSIKLTNEANNNTASSKTASNDQVTKVSPDASNTHPADANTTAKAFSDINTLYSDKLAAAEKISNETDRETQKSIVLKKWSKAIDDDVAKQKADYIASTDPEVKAQLSKKINDAENSSKEKNALADQSSAKAETLDKQNVAAASAFFNSNVKDTNSVTTTDVGITKDTAKKQFSYNDTAASNRINKANVLNDEANALMAQSVVYQFETVDKTSAIAKKERKKQGDALVKRAHDKKVQASKLFAEGNKTEYNSNQTQIKPLTSKYSANKSPEILKAQALNDEAKKYFDKAQQHRGKANSASEYNSLSAELDAAKTNEMIALEKQKQSIDIYKNYDPNAVTTPLAASNAVDTSHYFADNTKPIKDIAEPIKDNTKPIKDNANPVKDNTEPLNDNTVIAENTAVNELSDINKKFESDLAATEKIKNESDREKEKAVVLNKWSGAIDADAAKQKQELAAATDPKKKAQLAKRISESEISSKDKQTQADQSSAKSKALKQTDIAAVKTPDKTNAKDNNTLIAVNKASADSIKADTKDNTPEIAVKKAAVISENSNTKNNDDSKNSIANSSSKNKNTNAASLDKQADSLITQSNDLKLQALKQNNPAAKKELSSKSAGLVKQAHENKIKAAELNADANKAEYTANSNQLKTLAKSYSATNSDDLSMADMMNDEALIYFDKAQKIRSRADSTSSFEEKETLLKDAEKNEMLALDKQKKSEDIYKNHKTTVIYASTVHAVPVNNTKIITNPEIAKNTDSSAKPNVKGGEPLALTSKNTVKNTVLPVNPAKEEHINTTGSNTKTNVPANTTIPEKQNVYKDPAAIEQISKSDLLNKQTNDLLTESVALKSKAVKESDIDAKNKIYTKSEELTKEAQGKKLLAFQLTADANATEYNSNQNQLDQLAKASSSNNDAELLKAEIVNDEAKKHFDEAKKQRIEAGSTDSYSSKETKLTDAQNNETVALEKQRESIDLYKKHIPNIAASNKNQASNNNTSQPTKVSHENTSLPDNSAGDEHKIIITDITPLISGFVLTPNEVFEQKSVPVYSYKNPIPINNKLPEGLIFKVQIGAFRNPIPQDLFQGIYPINGETTPAGFIRYTAGVFEKYSTADKIKNKIVEIGYKDAFVAAFLNGKRIPINQAYAMAGGTPATVLQVNNPAENTNHNPAVVKPEIIPALPAEEQSEIAKSKSLSAVSGLFYTVQVGVFSKPVLADRVYSMTPLYTETASNGYLRYYTGIYKTILRASEAKDMVIDIGIKDAFVTAYYNGKRISIPEAKQYETKGDGVFSTEPILNKLPVFKAVSKQKLKPEIKPEIKSDIEDPDSNDKITIVDITNSDGQPPVVNNEAAHKLNKIAVSNNTSIIESDGVIFKIQIGAFSEEVPLDIANKFLKIARLGIKNYKDNTGLTIYTVGNLKTYDEAISLKKEVAAESLPDAFIVAYRNGEKIPVDEAKQKK